MGFFDSISGSIDGMQKRAFNAQFGGGCPICKADNSLSIVKDDDVDILCGRCGAAFKKIMPIGVDIFRGLETLCIQLVRGDERYLNKAFPLGVWRVIRSMSSDDRVVGFFRGKNASFYATTVGIIRETRKYDFLSYADVSDIRLQKVWSPGPIHLLLLFISVFAAFLSAFFVLYLLPSESLFFLPLLFLLFGVAVMALSKRWVYQIDSPLLSKKELRGWRLDDVESGNVKCLVSIVSEQLRRKRSEAVEA